MADHDSILALTMGDPAGIGPELTLEAWLRRHESGLPSFAVLADPALLSAARRVLGWSVPIAEVAIDQAARVFPDACPVCRSGLRHRSHPGILASGCAGATIELIETAVRLVRSGAGRRPRHEPYREARALRRRLQASGPHGVPGRARGRAGSPRRRIR